MAELKKNSERVPRKENKTAAGKQTIKRADSKNKPGNQSTYNDD